MSISAALAGGFVGTLVLTSVMRAATELGWTRIDLPFLLGTAFTGDRTRAKALGYALHFAFGLGFALLYLAVFAAVGAKSWWLGGAIGAVHALFAGTALVNLLLPLVHPALGTPETAADESVLLEPAGFMLLNYGRATPHPRRARRAPRLRGGDRRLRRVDVRTVPGPRPRTRRSLSRVVAGGRETARPAYVGALAGCSSGSRSRPRSTRATR